MISPILANIKLAPPDPILGLTEAFVADLNPCKVNLGQGVYTDEQGQVPILECIRQARERLISSGKPHSYLGSHGLPSFGLAVEQHLALAPAGVDAQRLVTVQTLGGTGALRIGADFLKLVRPEAQAFISDPSWENHRNVFQQAGYEVGVYPYYDAESHRIRFDALLEKCVSMAPGTVLLLQSSCHNPTGADLSAEQWHTLAGVIAKQQIVPFLDNAYQGFSKGVEEDAVSIQALTTTCPVVLIATSFSKSLSLYGERVGALTIAADDRATAIRVLSQVKAIVRGAYSSPPNFGAQLAATVLNDEELTALWRLELAHMRNRIMEMRRALIDGIRSRRSDYDFSFIYAQAGMFSFSGLTKEQVQRLREQHAVYVLENGRICISALNASNVDYVSAVIAEAIG